jgi:cytochrome c-type biogenesis protein CcmH
MNADPNRTRWVTGLIVCTALLLGPATGRVAANIQALTFDSAAQESRYRSLVAELRCLVCQNQNLADSNAPLAQDLRRVTYQMIRSGSTDTEIIDFMVSRYGDFVLYRPPLKPATVLLWAGPAFFLLLGLVFAARTLRSNIRAAPEGNVDGQARLEARRLLEDHRE